MNYNKLKAAIGIFICLVAILPLFQNCGIPQLQTADVNPNQAPLDNAGKSLIAPNALKSKLIGGVEVPGFDTGTWIYVFVDDQCILSRKDIIFNSPLYFLDPYLKTQFDFASAVGRFNMSMVSFQLTSFVSQVNFDKALSLDNCASASYITSSIPIKASYAGPQTGQSSNPNWPQMGLDSSVMQSLLVLNKSTKVNVGVNAPGFKMDISPPLPLSPNGVGLPNTDPDGLGTFLSSLIALPKSASPAQGVADGVAQLIPVSYPTDYQNWIFSSLVFQQIKNLVNRGADVIDFNLVKKGFNFCDPLVGQALYYAIERGVTVVVPAGTGTVAEGPESLLGGEIVGPRDFNLFEARNTSQTSCWGRYFRGVITVGARDSQSTVNVANFSNYGSEGVEILAPGVDALGANHQSQLVKSSSTEAAAAFVTGAVAHIISFYKSKGWFYSPWLIEDTLMNGSSQATALPDSGVTVRRKKYLDFTALKNFLTTLNAGSEELARQQATDNPEAGQSIFLSQIKPGEKPIKLDVFTKNGQIYVKDRNQFQAVFYYASGAVEVVTDQVTWSSSDPINFPVDLNGIVRPLVPGNFTITARYNTLNLTNSYSARAVEFDTISGESTKLLRLELRDLWSTTKSVKTIPGGYQMLSPFLYVDVWAIYDNGIARKVTDNTVYTIMLDGQVLGEDYIRTFSTATYLMKFYAFRGGRTHDLTLFYRGFQQNLKIELPTYNWVGWKWHSNYNSSTFNKSVASHTETSTTLYNLGFWYNIQFKIPFCSMNSVEFVCPGNDVTSAIWSCNGGCGIEPTTTLPAAMLGAPSGTAYGSNAVPGVYTVDQKYYFWGDNTGSPRTSSITVEVINAPRTPVMAYAGWGFGKSSQNSSPDSSEGTTQLAPVCSGLEGIIYNENKTFDVSEFLRYQVYNSAATISIDSSAGVYSNYQADSSTTGILMRGSGQNVVLNVFVNDLNISAKVKGPSKITEDPFDPQLGAAELAFGPLNFVTPKSLPALPAAPSANPLCSQPVKTNGTHGGTGTAADPYILCKFSELKAVPINFTSTYGLYFALGDDLDLSGELKPPANPFKLDQLDGRNYRIKNANFTDLENHVYILDGIQRLHDVVFVNNAVYGRYAGLMRGVYKAWNIYAYDNTIDGQYISLVTDNISYMRNIYTKNILRYSILGTGIANTSVVAIMESFSSDTVNYTGLPGDGSFSGVGLNVIASGSSSKITGGQWIGGVASNFCYKCYSEVEIFTTNSQIVGGIVKSMSRAGNIELGESKARITVAGSGVTGGLVGRIQQDTVNNGFWYNYGPEGASSAYLNLKFGHTHIMNSRFTGTISGTGFLGGAIGHDRSPSDTWFSNSDFSGTVSGAGTKGSLIGTADTRCLSSIRKDIKIKSVNLTGGLPVLGNGIDGQPLQTAVPF